MFDFAYSLEIAGAIPSDAMIMNESTDRMNGGCRWGLVWPGDGRDEAGGEVERAGESRGVWSFREHLIETCVDDKKLGTTRVERLKNGECRSRLCVQDFAITERDEYFAPTPAE